VTAAAGGLRRLLLYSHDTYGLGHLRRNLAIAGYLLRRSPGLQVVLLTGSPVSDYFEVPPNLSLVRLPAVVKHGAERYGSRVPGLPFGLVRRARSAVMTDVARRFRPDVLLVDHAPMGMGGELLPVLDTLRRHSPATRVVLGLRDVLDDAATVCRTWGEQGIYRLLAEAYDDVLVYGCREMYDVGAQYAMPPEVSGRLRYCGYIRREESTGRRPNAQVPADRGYLLGTAGGGGDGVQVLAATLEAGRQLGRPVVLVTGPLMATADRAKLAAAAADSPHATVVEFLPNMRAAMAAAGAVVTMGGYNSLCEVVTSGVPAVVVPRTAPRVEQAIRAELFARRGLVQVVRPGPDLADRLAAAVASAISATVPAEPLDMAGLDRIADALSAYQRGRLPVPVAARDRDGRLDETRERVPA